MITIEEVIAFFEQNEYPPESFWCFKEPKEAAAVVRAQHEEIERLRAELADVRADQSECNSGNEWQAAEIEKLKQEAKEWKAFYFEAVQKLMDTREGRLNTLRGEPK